MEFIKEILKLNLRLSVLKLSLWDYRDVYIVVNRTIAVADTLPAALDNVNKIEIFKNCISFTDCISKINKTKRDNAKEIDVVIPMYNLIEYSDNYTKASGILRLFYRVALALDDNGNIIDIAVYNITDSFKFKERKNKSNRRRWHKEC